MDGTRTYNDGIFAANVYGRLFCPQRVICEDASYEHAHEGISSRSSVCEEDDRDEHARDEHDRDEHDKDEHERRGGDGDPGANCTYRQVVSRRRPLSSIWWLARTRRNEAIVMLAHQCDNGMWK